MANRRAAMRKIREALRRPGRIRARTGYSLSFGLYVVIDGDSAVATGIDQCSVRRHQPKDAIDNNSIAVTPGRPHYLDLRLIFRRFIEKKAGPDQLNLKNNESPLSLQIEDLPVPPPGDSCLLSDVLSVS